MVTQPGEPGLEAGCVGVEHMQFCPLHKTASEVLGEEGAQGTYRYRRNGENEKF